MKVNQVPHIHPLTSEACTWQPTTAHGKTCHLPGCCRTSGGIRTSLDNLRLRTRQILFQVHLKLFSKCNRRKARGYRDSIQKPYEILGDKSWTASHAVVFFFLLPPNNLSAARSQTHHRPVRDHGLVADNHRPAALRVIPLGLCLFPHYSDDSVSAYVCIVCRWEWLIWLSKMIHIHCTTCQLFRQW